MNKNSIKKIMVYDEGTFDRPHDSFYQIMTKMQQLFSECDVDFVRFCLDEQNHDTALSALESCVKDEKPDILIIAATALGEELAPALGVRLNCGVAAHCADITINDENRVAYMVPAFGGKVIGEIFIPGGQTAVATVKPGVFEGCAQSAGAYRTADGRAYAADGSEPLIKITAEEEADNSLSDIEKAELIFCGGFGIGSENAWKKIIRIAGMTGGGAGCTRPVVDMGWGADEYSMIGTSGKTVRPKVYVGFGISGAAHHLCGIKEAGTVININNDENAASFNASDYKAKAGAEEVMDALLRKL